MSQCCGIRLVGPRFGRARKGEDLATGYAVPRRRLTATC